jgi:hypothetical protein
MEVAERAQESICGNSTGRWHRDSEARDKLQNLKVLLKALTATPLVPLHRIPPPKESMKCSAENRRLKMRIAVLWKIAMVLE